jgi:transposase
MTNEEAARLIAEVETLRRQLAAALARIAELEAQLEQRKAEPAVPVKPNQAPSNGPKRPRKRRAAKHNASRKRMQPTRIERHALERCPECHYRLHGESIGYTREVIELPPPQPVEVTEHQIVKRWCPRCRRWHSPHLDLHGQVLGQGRIGVRIASLVAYLRTTVRMSVAGLQAYLETIHGLRLSRGEIVELCHAVGGALQGTGAQLLACARAEPAVHMDETGWREDGQNGYVWVVATDGPAAVRYFEFDRSRGHRVARRLLQTGFAGVLVSDFYAAYNLVPGRHQRCWVHLLRDLHKLKEDYPERVDVLDWAQAVRQVYEDAPARLAQPVLREERHAVYQRLRQRSEALGCQYARAAEHPCNALAKRLLRHQDELFEFLLVPGLPSDNNLAERAIRPLVVLRKVSGGSRSPQGTRTRMLLASLFGTWQARHLNPFQQCLAALQRPARAASFAAA